MNITIAGASGFIGKNLIKNLDTNLSIKALSRTSKISKDKNVTWVEVDLFSLSSTIAALKDTDIAIYLVHSMMPSSRLFQGNFQDTDLLLADNFARACHKEKVKQMIYLGGLIPEAGSFSKHLTSRKEVEDVLRYTNIPITVLRAGMAVGDGGSSFEILKNLVLNLPFMLLPKWTKNKTQTIYIDDLIAVIIKSINNKMFFNKTINIVTGETLTYKNLIEQTIDHFGKKKILIPIPFFYIRFSKLWVTIFGETDYELVSPLIDSLMCDLPMTSISPMIEDVIKYRSFKEMLKMVSTNKIVKKGSRSKLVDRTVRSIQRLPNPNRLNNETIYKKYISWLPSNFKYFIRINEINDLIIFYFFMLKIPLLILKKIQEKENVDRVKFHIIGGILTQTTNTGSLEFRQVASGKYALATVHGFFPSLPWYIYKYTQAPLHKHIMKKFGKTLK
ncbi:MAG: NAD(P)H-binding protein [Bacteriovorax sp.]|nr:NAD(P)H-binding protein [Bacteriovorax sp.]